MRRVLTPIRVAALCSLGLLAASCGTDDATSDTTGAELPTIVVTTNILGDIVSQTVGDLAEVEVIMPVGADPHDFAPSAKQAESMENADLLVVNGAGFEEGMIDIIDQVESSGTPVFEFADHVELLAFDGDHSGEDGHSDETNSDEANSDDKGDDHSGDDPHIWTDPSRMATAVEAFGAELTQLEGIDAEAADTQVQAYLDELRSLDAAMEDTLSAVPAENRVLVTNHEVFGYFADRFGFEVVGAVIPSLTTNAEPSTAEVEALVELIEQEQIPAIFAETSGSTRLSDAIAESAGTEVAVVVLYSESLGEPGSGADTYIGMMNKNAALIADALAPV